MKYSNIQFYEQKRIKRIQKEIQDFKADKIKHEHEGINLLEMKEFQSGIFQFCGAINTPYQGYWFRVEIRWPKYYPYQPLMIRFIDKVWNPYVDINTGDICVDILNDQHTPALKTQQVILSISSLISETKLNIQEFVNIQAADQLRTNPDQYDRVIKNMCIEQKLRYEAIYDDAQVKAYQKLEQKNQNPQKEEKIDEEKEKQAAQDKDKDKVQNGNRKTKQITKRFKQKNDENEEDYE